MNAVGVWFYCVNTNRYLYLMRMNQRNPGTWGLPGGKVESGESLHGAIVRECEEELGFMPNYINLVPLEMFTSPDKKFCYHTFFSSVNEEFRPNLNEEHVGYAWLESGFMPKPLHPGLWNTVNFDVVQAKIAAVKDRLQSIQNH